MKLVYKIDILNALKLKGYSQYRIRNEKILGQLTVTRLRNSQPVSFDVLAKLCTLLDCDIGDILQLVPDDTLKPTE